MPQVLFYRVLLDNFVSMSAVVYTPTVGWACLNYHKCGPRVADYGFVCLGRKPCSQQILLTQAKSWSCMEPPL